MLLEIGRGFDLMPFEAYIHVLCSILENRWLNLHLPIIHTTPPHGSWVFLCVSSARRGGRLCLASFETFAFLAEFSGRNDVTTSSIWPRPQAARR